MLGLRWWTTLYLILAIWASMPFAFIALDALAHPARAACAKTTDKELQPMCQELGLTVGTAPDGT